MNTTGQRLHARGFTLLELLVSMFVLAIIVIGCAMLYHQASLAYESGVDRTEMTLVGRGVAQLMAAEISDAVVVPNIITGDPLIVARQAAFDFNLDASGNRIQFARLTTSGPGSANSGRAAVRVEYKIDATSHVLTRQMTTYTNDTYRPFASSVGQKYAIGTNIYNIDFVPDDPNWPQVTNGLPKFVDIYVDMLGQQDIDRGRTGPINYMTYHARAYMANRNRDE